MEELKRKLTKAAKGKTLLSYFIKPQVWRGSTWEIQLWDNHFYFLVNYDRPDKIFEYVHLETFLRSELVPSKIKQIILFNINCFQSSGQ